MDHIQKIVERAKAKQIDEDKMTSASNIIDKKKSKLNPHDFNSGNLDLLDDITYTHTKIITTDPNELKKRRLIAGLRNDPISTPFRMLRAQVLQQLRESNWTRQVKWL